MSAPAAVTPFTVIVPGATLAGDSAGDGPAVLLLHAGVCDWTMWDGDVAALVAAGYRAVRLDLRGWGESAQHATDGDVPFSWHDDALAVFDHLAIDRAAFVGCSFGAGIALHTALAAPDRVAALVLVSVKPAGLPGDAVAEETDAAVEAALDAGDIDRANELELRLWVDGPNRTPDAVDPAVRAAVGRTNRASLERSVATGWYGQGAVPLAPPAIERLGDVTVPTLVVLGEHDLPGFHAAGHLLRDGLPSAALLRIDGAAHLPTMERPDVFQPALLRFLNASHPPR